MSNWEFSNGARQERHPRMQTASAKARGRQEQRSSFGERFNPVKHDLLQTRWGEAGLGQVDRRQDEKSLIRLLQRPVRNRLLPREKNASARKDETVGVCRKGSFLILRATFHSQNIKWLIFCVVTRQIISLWPEPNDQWVRVIWIVIIHICECFPGLCCDVYIWTNFLLHHLFKDDPHRWLAAYHMPHILSCALPVKRKKKNALKSVYACVFIKQSENNYSQRTKSITFIKDEWNDMGVQWRRSGWAGEGVTRGWRKSRKDR